MKRIVSVLIAVLLLSSCFLSLPVLADGTETSGEPVEVANIDFAKKYQDLNLTQPTDATGLENLGIGVADKTSVKYQKAKAVLTADGLTFSSVSFRAHGVSLGTSLAEKTDYTVEAAMKFDASGDNCYLFFGFANDKNGDGAWEIVNDGTNFRFSGDQMVFNAGYAFDNADNAKALKTAIRNEKKVASYRFVVEGGKLAKVIVSCGDVTVTYANTDPASQISAQKGKFTLACRADGDQVLAVTLEKLTVTEKDATAALVEKDYKSIWTEKQLTAETPAADLAEALGIEVIERLQNTYRGKNYQTLTDKGLAVGSWSDHVSAYVALNDMTDYREYVYEYTMAIAQGNKKNNYLVYGFGFDPDAHTDQWCFTKRVEGENYSVLVFKSDDLYSWADFAATDDDANKTNAKALNAAIADGEFLTYRFYVKNGKMNTFSVTFGDKTVTYTNAAKGLTVDPKSMTLSFRCDGGSSSAAVLRSMRISGVRGEVDPPKPVEPLENILTPNRKQPAEPELAYSDTADTKYKAGYVLHYMDFAKVTDFSKTGYFVTNDAEPDAFMIKDGELRVKTNSGDGVKVMLTGNGIPKNIQNFTVQIRFRFVEPSPSYFVFIQSNTIGEDGKTSGEKNTCFRYNGELDNCTTTMEEETVKAFWEAVRAGKEVTFTYSAMERETYRIIATCEGQTIVWFKDSNTISTSNSFFGFMVGRGTNLAISSVAVIAETPDDYAESGLIWPGEANALVQNVSADAVAKDEPEQPQPPTPEPPTPEPPTSEKPTTEAPTGGKTEEPTSGTSGKESRGCQSSADAGWAILAILLSGALAGGLVKKRRKD